MMLPYKSLKEINKEIITYTYKLYEQDNLYHTGKIDEKELLTFIRSVEHAIEQIQTFALSRMIATEQEKQTYQNLLNHLTTLIKEIKDKYVETKIKNYTSKTNL